MNLKCYGKSCLENNLKYPKTDLIKFKSKNYCRKHYPRVKQDSIDRQKLINCIKHYYHIDFPTGLMLKQIKDYHEKLEFSYSGIIEAIEFVNSLQNVTLTTKYGLGIIPYYYEQAQAVRKQAAASKNENVKIKQRNIAIKSSRFAENDYGKKRIMQMNDLNIEED